jgi:hypothetical protein
MELRWAVMSEIDLQIEAWEDRISWLWDDRKRLISKLDENDAAICKAQAKLEELQKKKAEEESNGL